MAKRGRPNVYDTVIKPRFDDIIIWAKAGATNVEIASALGIGLSTFQDHIANNEELRDALKQAKMSGVPEIKMALYKRAMGYEVEEVKKGVRPGKDGELIQYTEVTKKHIAPDVGAIQTYLRNFSDGFRDRDKYTYDFKQMEIDLKKQIAERNDF